MRSKKFSFLIKHLFIAIFTLSCLLIPVNIVFAEEANVEWGFSAFLYDNSNGLLTSEANAIAQTGNGFIWIGGYSGLTRYDGNNFYHFDSSTGITSVNTLYVDSKDRLWIGTNDNGVVVRVRGEFQFFGREDGLISLSVRAICEDAAGNIILATTEGMAYINNDYELHMVEDPRIEEKYVRILKADADGIIYGSTMDSCIFSMENLELTSFYDGGELGIGDIICITPDLNEKGKVYLGTGGSDIVCGNMMDGMKVKTSLSVSPQERINDIYLSPNHRMWISANNGMGYFDNNGKYTEMKNIPMNSSIGTIIVDVEGNLWCTSSRQGIMKIIKSPFINITALAGLDPVVVNTTCIYQDDLYIGTDVGLQLVDKKYNQKENVLTELLKGVRIRSIKADSSGNLWLCTYSNDTDYGLVCYYGDGTYKIYNEKSGMVSGKIRTTTELSDGTIAVAGSGGVNLIKDGEVIDTYDSEVGIHNTEILSIVEGENGSLYFGSDGGGLYIMENDGRLKQMGLDDGLKSEVVMQLHKDPERGVYWIITGNSIAYMKDEEIHTLTNFPYSNNIDMLFDDQGGIWVLSSNGIYFVNGDNLLSNKELLYSFYDIRSGLPSIATANSRNYISSDGTLYIAGGTGVSSININTAREGKNAARLVIPFVEIDEKEVYVGEGETVILPPDCKRITFEGYALTYAHNPQLNYYLEGFDDEVTTVSRLDMKPVSYTNLNSGEYVFHLSSIDVMTGDEINSISVTIVKEKAFFEYVSFWVLVLVLVALVILLIVRIYTRKKMEKLLKKEEEDKLFIRQMIQVFAKSIDIKDEYTNGHSFRVAEYTKMIAEKSGYSQAEVENIYNIALMHDMGKITIPNEILNKPGRLTDEEFVIMKQHAMNGYEILKEVEISPELALGAGYHHERMDGKGYPLGKTADEIPDVAQMIAVADTFDAMHSTRPYRKKMKMEDIIAELKRVAGTQLNEKYVQVLLSLIDARKIEW